MMSNGSESAASIIHFLTAVHYHFITALYSLLLMSHLHNFYIRMLFTNCQLMIC